MAVTISGSTGIDKVVDGSIATVDLADNAVATAKIANDAVTTDKLNLISTSSVPSLEARSDGTTDGYIQLNCSANSHGVKIKSPPHSAGASYTLTLPNNDGDANQFLQTNGSGVTSWAAPGGGGLDLISTLATSGATSYSTGAISFVGYKLVQIWTDLVTHDGSGGNQRLQMTTNGGSASQLGNGDIPAVDTVMSQTTFDLSNGSFLSLMRVNPTINGLPASFAGGARNPGFTTSTTSIKFDWSSGGAFDGGTIRIYGLK